MKRTKLIGDVFHSVTPELAAGPWSVGYSGHTNESAFFAYPDFEITNIKNVTSPVTVMNDVYIDYSYTSGITTVTGETSIYVY